MILNLRYGNTLLAIKPEVGSCITRYCLKTEEQVLELMRPANQAGLSAKNQLEMDCFPLIPFANRINNGRFSFQGEQIKMLANSGLEVHTIHGQGWKAAWTVCEVEENRAVIADQYFLDECSFPYLARQIFELNGPSLTVNLQITNSGKPALPSGIELHPYFVRTPLAAITAKTEKMRVNDFENIPLWLQSVQESDCLSQGVTVNQKAMDNIFCGWNREVLISWPEWKKTFKISAEAPLDFLVIFTHKNEDYFCVEPVSHVNDAFNLLDRGDLWTGAKILLPD